MPETLWVEVNRVYVHEEEVRVHGAGEVTQELAHVLDGHKLQQAGLELAQNA